MVNAGRQRTVARPDLNGWHSSYLAKDLLQWWLRQRREGIARARRMGEWVVMIGE
jgi:hypothetical protein